MLGARASPQQNTLPVRDKRKLCLAETLVRLSRTSSQRTKPKAKNHQRHRSCTATAEQKPPRNAPIRPLPSRNHLGTLLLGPCRAKATPERSHSAPAVREAPGSAPARPLPSGSLPSALTRPGVTPPQPSSPAVFGSGKHYACRHLATRGLGHPYKP